VIKESGVFMKKMLLLLLVLLVGCTGKYDVVNQYEESYLYYSDKEEYEYREVIRLVDDGVYYNVYFNIRYLVEYDGLLYQSFDEIQELLTLIGPEELYLIGYRMEKIHIGRSMWERNFDVEDIND